MTRVRLALVVAVAFTVGVAAVASRRRDVAAPPATTSCGERASCSEEAPGDMSAAPPSVAAASRVPPARTAVAAVTPPGTAAPSASPVAAARREDVDRLLAEGKVMEAVDAFRAVVAAEPSAKNHGDFGSLLYQLTAFDEAAVHLRAAAELEPGDADRWIALANVYYRKVNPGEAWKAEKRARAAEPGLELGRDAEGMRIRKGAPTAQRP